MVNVDINYAENLALAYSIGQNEGFLSGEVLDQMKALKPISELMVKQAIIDYLTKPNYSESPAANRIPEQQIASSIKNLLNHPDEAKVALIGSGLTRECNRIMLEVADQTESENQDSTMYLTIEPEDVEALCMINPTALGERSVQANTAMSDAMAILWKNKLYDPNQVYLNKEAIDLAYQAIHANIEKRLNLKRGLLQMVNERRQAAEALLKPYKARSKYLFNGWEGVIDPVHTYGAMIDISQTIFMMNKFSENDPDSASKFLKKQLRNTASSAKSTRKTSLVELMALFNTEMSRVLAKEIGLAPDGTDQLLDLRELGNLVSLSFEDTHPSLEDQNIILHYLPPNPKAGKLTQLELIGIQRFKEALILSKHQPS